MDKYKISCVHYPTTVVIIDDNKAFLENMQLNLSKHTLCKTFSDPQEGLNYILKSTKEHALLKDVIGVDVGSESYTHSSGQLPVQFDISQLHLHAYSEDPYSEIAVVVVDFEMPNINGAEICRQLRDAGCPVKIIMLTGEADEPMAIKIFNEKLIDKFILKGQPGLDETLKNSIIEMKKNYFQDLSYPIIRGLISDQDSSLGDPAFKSFFEKIAQDLSASSYYLIELSGSFIFIDNAGKPMWLIIRTSSALEEIADQMEDAELPVDLVASVREGKMIPYFPNYEEDIFSDASVFKKHLHKAEKLKGNKEYSYALIKELSDFPFEADKILPFNQYKARN